jgi:hypothetical protein
VTGFLDILGVRFRVEETDGSSLSEGLLGISDIAHARITLLQGMDPGIKRRTLLHEVVHAVTDSLDLGLSEVKVQALAVGLASIPQLELTPERESAVTLGGPIGLIEK